MPNGAFPFFFFFFFFFFGRFRFCRLPLLSIRNEPSRPIAVPPSVPTRSLIFFSLAISVPQPLPVVFFLFFSNEDERKGKASARRDELRMPLLDKEIHFWKQSVNYV